MLASNNMHKPLFSSTPYIYTPYPLFNLHQQRALLSHCAPLISGALHSLTLGDDHT